MTTPTLLVDPLLEGWGSAEGSIDDWRADAVELLLNRIENSGVTVAEVIRAGGQESLRPTTVLKALNGGRARQATIYSLAASVGFSPEEFRRDLRDLRLERFIQEIQAGSAAPIPSLPTIRVSHQRLDQVADPAIRFALPMIKVLAGNEADTNPDEVSLSEPLIRTLASIGHLEPFRCWQLFGAGIDTSNLPQDAPDQISGSEPRRARRRRTDRTPVSLAS